MGSKVTGVKIKGIGKYVPEMVATNEDFTKIVETSDEWITQKQASSKDTSQMASLHTILEQWRQRLQWLTQE